MAAGEQIPRTRSEELTTAYGRGFGVKDLSLMVRFAKL
jgi:hypothetical protein